MHPAPVKLLVGGLGLFLSVCCVSKTGDEPCPQRIHKKHQSHNEKSRNRIVLAEAHSFNLILMVSFIKPDFRLFVLALIGTSS